MRDLKPIPLADRKVDILFLGFFILNISFITYIVDIEQIIVRQSLYPLPDKENFPSYPWWPPPIFVDLIHWWGINFDPVLLARPIWWKVTIWWDALFFGPFYAFAIYAFYCGKEWIRLPAIFYSSVILTILTVILTEELFGDFQTPMRFWVLLANAPWVAFPLLLLSRMLLNDHPFHYDKKKERSDWSPFTRTVFAVWGFFSGFMAYYVTTYLWVFLLDLHRFPEWFPKTINLNHGQLSSGPFNVADAIFDTILLLSFCFQHTAMASESVKKILKNRAIPAPLYRGAYVILSAFWLWACFHAWKPLPQVVYRLPVFGGLAYVPFVLGVFIAFVASLQWGHTSLIGLHEGLTAQDSPQQLTNSGLWGKMRQPILFGYLLALWGTPEMTQGRLLFAGILTLYIFIASRFEEMRHAQNIQGYRDYQKVVKSWFFF